METKEMALTKAERTYLRLQNNLIWVRRVKCVKTVRRLVILPVVGEGPREVTIVKGQEYWASPVRGMKIAWVWTMGEEFLGGWRWRWFEGL